MKDTPAFPHTIEHLHEPVTTGMTLRDYFAARAMQSILARTDSGFSITLEFVSGKAYQYADAMLKAREQ
jgi:hypothetical protein